MCRVLARFGGAAALHFAAEEGDADCARILHQAQADPSLRNDQGRTPMDFVEDELGEVPAPIAALLPENTGAGPSPKPSGGLCG